MKPKKVSEAELAAMEVRERAATPGPWVSRGKYPHICWQKSSEDSHILSATLSERPEADIIFTANARTDVPRLIADVRHYRAQLNVYADRLKVAISLLNEDHRHSRAAGEGILDDLLDNLKKEAGG